MVRRYPRRAPLVRVAALVSFLLAQAAVRLQAQETQADRIALRLRAAEQERAEVSQTLPLLALGLGIAAVAVGLGVGTGAVLECQSACEMPTWVGPTIIAGGMLASAGTVWWIRTDRESDELDLRIARLRSDLRVATGARAANDGESAGLRTTLTLRFAF